MVKRRHWIDRMAGRSILLEDSAEPVPHYGPEDSEAWISIVVRGVSELKVVACGPAAPLPLPGVDHALRSLEGAVIERLRAGLCNAAGPDGARCELAPKHTALPYRDDRMHAATTDEGLVRW